MAPGSADSCCCCIVGTSDGGTSFTLDGNWAQAAAWCAGTVAALGCSGTCETALSVVTFHDSSNAFRWRMYRTTDGGKSWKRLVYGEDIPAHVLSVVQDPEVADLLFLGTEEGLHFSVDRGVNWRRWSHDIPAVPVRDMVIQPREGDLVLGTFGRAAYVVEDLSPLRALAREGAAVLNGLYEARQRFKWERNRTDFRETSARPSSRSTTRRVTSTTR